MLNISNRDFRFIDTALTHAASSEKVAAARVSAILVIKNRIIAFGTNRRKSHPFQAEYGKNKDSIFLHAETDCIKNALKSVDMEDLRKATMYVARVKKHEGRDVWGMAKSCCGCTRAIVEFGIKRVVYTTDTMGVCEVLMRS